MATQLLTAEEVAALLKVSVKIVWRLARQKQLPGFMLGKAWRFHPDAVDRFALQQSGLQDKPKRGRKLTNYSALYQSYEQHLH